MNLTGRHFKKTIILLSVRWYLAYPLSYRHIKELMAERGVDVDHSTINRWVVYYSPRLKANFCKNHKRKVNGSWRMDKNGFNRATLKNINHTLQSNQQITIRQIKYLNNIVEQDYRFIKRIINPMKGFKSFKAANATLIGIELYHILHKRQHADVKNLSVFEKFHALAA